MEIAVKATLPFRKNTACIALFYSPDIKNDALEGIGEIWGTDEEGIVQPGIAAVGRSLELRGSLEIEGGIALGILVVVDDTPIANVDIYTIIRSDAVDSLQFRAMLRLVNELIISTTVDDGALDTRPLEGAASDRYDDALAVLCLPYPIRLTERHLQL